MAVRITLLLLLLCAKSEAQLPLFKVGESAVLPTGKYGSGLSFQQTVTLCELAYQLFWFARQAMQDNTGSEPEKRQEQQPKTEPSGQSSLIAQKIKAEADLFKRLDQQFQLQLVELGKWLKRYDFVKFIFVSDIDDTLIHKASHFTHPEIGQYQYLSFWLERRWQYRLQVFLDTFPNVLTIYNTARRSVSFNDTELIHFAEEYPPLHPPNMRYSSMKRMLKLENGKNRPPVHLPMPDALVTGSGIHIDINPEHKSRNADALSYINQQLNQWVTADVFPVRAHFYRLKQLFPGIRLDYSIYNKTPEFNRAYAFLRGVSTLSLNEEQFYRDVYSGFPFIVPTAMLKEHQVTDVLFSNTCVNKGTGLLLAIQSMHAAGLFEGKLALMSVLGDQIMDLPMILPEDAANALWPMTGIEKVHTHYRLFQTLGTRSLQEYGVAWLASVLYNSNHLLRYANPYIQAKIQHPKVIKIPSTSFGFLDGFQALVDRLWEFTSNEASAHP